MRRIFFLVLSLSCFQYIPAQVKSPGDFLGYELGAKFTRHSRVVDYFKNTVAAAPQMAKLEKYGETNEGRELILAYISSPENMAKLDEIRKNNLRLTGMLNDRPADLNTPAIVWLSYNVHGNEASSSEVSMKTLYELLNPSNTQTKEWLKNTVVIIDPCLNPDGRDRYVNWYYQVGGKTPDANWNSRERNEPWPYGRTNHYNFDLNRDWAWQTQVETQQRIKKYNEWLPQVHCDFHEQYPNNPYYFAPAAEPFHEVITGWQREFQTTIGKNHAKYFDANGWLYFTREIFDLFYPAYGDTYPTYNGAIGMTYEQAGHSPGGLAVTINDGDTLTLKDRIAHHFTTSMSTIEVTAINAARVVKEFRKFFDDAKTIVPEYRSYFLQTDDVNKAQVVKKLLDINGIDSKVSAYSANFTGFNYTTGKTEPVSINNRIGIIVHSNQPKAALIKVLFEPKTKISDSATYDITGWSIPYIYNVQGYAIKEKINAAESGLIGIENDKARSASYCLIVPASKNNTTFLAALLKHDCKVRFNERAFTAGNQVYGPGSLIILIKDNKDKRDWIVGEATRQNIQLSAISSGFVDKGFDFGSEKVHLIRKPKVAQFSGQGTYAESAGEIWHYFEQQLDYPITLINANDAGDVNWKDIDVLIMPAGNYKFLSDKDISAEIKAWVRRGGKIIAIDNAASQMASGDWGFKLKKNDEEKKDTGTYADVKRYEDREKESVSSNIPGAIYKVQLDNSHPLAFGYPDQYFTLKNSDNVYEFLKEGWNVGILKKDKQVSGFVGNKVADKIKDGTVIGVVPTGSGSVIFFGEDPVFRNFWEGGKMLLNNAVFFVGN